MGNVEKKIQDQKRVATNALIGTRRLKCLKHKQELPENAAQDL